MAWRYLEYCKVNVAMAWTRHGKRTRLTDRLLFVSENISGGMSFYSSFYCLQADDGNGNAPGLYFSPDAVFSTITQVALFGAETTLTGTVTFDHQDTADGQSRVRVYWNEKLVYDETMANLIEGANSGKHMAVYFLSDPAFAASLDSNGFTVYEYLESARVGEVTGNVYGDCKDDGTVASRGDRTLSWDDWWTDCGPTPNYGTQSTWLDGTRGTWAVRVSPNSYLKVSAGKIWSDGETLIQGLLFKPGTAELQIYLFGEAFGGSAISATVDRAYRTKVAYASADGDEILFRRIERAEDSSSWSAAVQVAAGSHCRHPSLAAYDEGVLTCWYMAGDMQKASQSTDDGRTWTEITNMLGNSLKNVNVVQHHGITMAVGVSNSKLYFCRSNDQGRTQDNLPWQAGGGAMQEVGACGDDARPAICWYPDGEVAVFAEDDDGEQIVFVNANSGYGSWTTVS